MYCGIRLLPIHFMSTNVGLLNNVKQLFCNLMSNIVALIVGFLIQARNILLVYNLILTKV